MVVLAADSLYFLMGSRLSFFRFARRMYNGDDLRGRGTDPDEWLKEWSQAAILTVLLGVS